jgi:hypothetical protein
MNDASHRTAKYEGHWRMSVEEVSTLPWPIPAPQWLGRTAFLRHLSVLEAAAERVACRGEVILPPVQVRAWT